MDTKLYNGDFVPFGNGFRTVTGSEEILQSSLIRLAVKKGSFAPLPSLGSELYRLKFGTGSSLADSAKALADDALAPLGVKVTAVLVNGGQDSLSLEFFLDDTDGSVSVSI